MTKPRDMAELRDRIGLRPGQLLTNPDGQIGDLLEYNGEIVRIGILDTGRIVEVPVEKLLEVRHDK